MTKIYEVYKKVLIARTQNKSKLDKLKKELYNKDIKFFISELDEFVNIENLEE
jgi:hypothetical protein